MLMKGCCCYKIQAVLFTRTNPFFNFLQRNYTTNTTRRVVVTTSVDEKIVLQFKDSRSTTVREVSALPGQLEKN